jgi:hypothetical protein
MFSGATIDANGVESFGVLWRFTGKRESVAPTSGLLRRNIDDAALPSFQFRIPLLAVLDALKSDNPASRRVGETWMRSSLKSYTRYGFQTSLHSSGSSEPIIVGCWTQ